MANIGAEVGRAINWRNKGNEALARKASDRALELLDLSFDTAATFPRLKEFARLREAVVDYFSTGLIRSHLQMCCGGSTLIRSITWRGGIGEVKAKYQWSVKTAAVLTYKTAA
jgi:hypothetical protein